VIGNVGSTPTCVVVIPAAGGARSLVGGFTIGVGTAARRMRLYELSGLLQADLTLSGVPSTVRGGNTGGTQGTDIVTGGSKSASGAGGALGNGFIDVLRSGPDGYSVVRSITLNGEPVSVDVADLDGDGVDDVVSANRVVVSGGTGSEVPVLAIMRSISGVLSDPIPFRPEGATEALSVALLDVDGDGDKDLVEVHRDATANTFARLYRVDTAGQGTPLAIVPVLDLAVGKSLGTTTAAVSVANIDGDLRQDALLVLGAPVGGTVVGGIFVARPDPLLGDLDGDDVVSNADIGLLLLDFGPCPGCASDLDGNGEVDSGDIAFLLLLFS
jgi:hypothetical protein